MLKFVPMIALGVVLSVVPGCDTGARITRLEKQNEELKAEIRKNQAAADFDLQAKCAKDSKTWFRENWGNGDKDTITLTYVNHYNEKMNRCFIRVEYHYKQDQNGSWMNDIGLWDVYENSRYGHVVEDHVHILKPDLSWTTSVLECQMLSKDCKGKDEFIDLTGSYLND